MNRSTVFASVALVPLLVAACGSDGFLPPGSDADSSPDASEADVEAVPPPMPRRDAGAAADADPNDGAVDSADAASSNDAAAVHDASDAGALDAAPPPPPPPAPPASCAALAPADAIFVSPSGADSPACGTQAAPCAKLQTAIERAASTATFRVRADVGTYTEAIALRAGVSVIGGHVRAGATWGASCTAGRVKIVAPSSTNEGVIAAALTSPVRLASLDVQSKDAAAPGESIYGVFVSGNTALTLDDVNVTTATAGDGTAGANGVAGGPGERRCTNPPGDGSTPAPGAPGVAVAGAFTAAGYVAGSGTRGADGARGGDGVKGTDPTCEPGFGCKVDNGACIVEAPYALQQSCGSAGNVGCGGSAGTAGAGGTGGGSSIGVYAWGATVTVTGGRLAAGSGGRGGAGGAGGAGGLGAVGIPGSDSGRVLSTDGNYECAFQPFCEISRVANPLRGKAGSAGGPGGDGSAGGGGAGGAGGSSYAYYAGGGAKVTVTSTTALSHGNGGAGGAGGAAANRGADGVGKNSN